MRARIIRIFFRYISHNELKEINEKKRDKRVSLYIITDLMIFCVCVVLNLINILIKLIKYVLALSPVFKSTRPPAITAAAATKDNL